MTYLARLPFRSTRDVLSLVVDWIITIGNSSSASTKICQKTALVFLTVCLTETATNLSQENEFDFHENKHAMYA